VTYWRSGAAGAAVRPVSEPGKRRTIIFAINFRAVPAIRNDDRRNDAGRRDGLPSRAGRQADRGGQLALRISLPITRT
jgi:hypothetical protein